MKFIIGILAAIGAVVVLGVLCIILLYVFVAWRVTLRARKALQEFAALQGQTVDADDFREVSSLDDVDIPPMRIRLEQRPDSDWFDDPVVDEVTGTLQAEGFQQLGDFEVRELPGSHLRVLQSADLKLLASIRSDREAEEPYVELCFDLGEGRRGGVSNPPNATLPLPPDAVGQHFNESLWNSDDLVLRMLELARSLAESHQAIAIEPKEVRAFFEQAHASEMDYRILRGGLTSEEIRSSLEQFEEHVKESDIHHIQFEWQHAIETFLVEQSDRGRGLFHKESAVMVVYDGTMASFLLERLLAYYQEFEELTPGELDRIGGELKELLRRFSPREAIARFRPLLPEAIRYNLIDQLHKPVEADLYLLPE